MARSWLRSVSCCDILAMTATTVCCSSTSGSDLCSRRRRSRCSRRSEERNWMMLFSRKTSATGERELRRWKRRRRLAFAGACSHRDAGRDVSETCHDKRSFDESTCGIRSTSAGTAPARMAADQWTRWLCFGNDLWKRDARRYHGLVDRGIAGAARAGDDVQSSRGGAPGRGRCAPCNSAAKSRAIRPICRGQPGCSLTEFRLEQQVADVALPDRRES